jgi:hypothetical protein
MGKRERQKGQEWEREVAARINEACPGAEARRGLQGQGEQDTGIADVVSKLPFHMEAKWRKAPSVRAALKQAMAAAGEGMHPVAVVKDAGCKIGVSALEYVAMPLDDWLELVGQWWRETGRCE